MFNRIRVRMIALIVLMSLSITALYPRLALAFQSSFTWSLSSDTAAPQFDHEDSPLTVINDGGNLWVVYSNGAGTWYTLKGTTMDNLTQQSPFDTGSAPAYGFTRPNGDDAYWANGGWADPTTGTWYMTVHIEFHYGNPNVGYNHFRRVGLATSTDHGQSWTFQGDILTSKNPTGSLADYSGSYFDFGVGDQNLTVDNAGGYFYLFYENVWFNKSSGYRYLVNRVARSPISAKMAPGSWRYWYAGGWTEPGLGGLASDLPFRNTGGGASVFYNTYLNKWVGIAYTQTTPNATIDAGTIATATDLGAQNWTEQDNFSAPSRIQWYDTPIDPATWNHQSIGQTFRLYSASNSVLGGGKYMTVTFSGGTSTGWTPPAQNLPGVSVRDGNAGWQTDPTPGTPQLSSATGGAQKITLNWTAVSGATGYKIKYGETSGDYESSLNVGTTTTTDVGSLKPGQTYYFKVLAFTNSAFGGYSSEINAQTLSGGSTPITINDTDNGITYSGNTWTYHPARGLGDYQDDVHAASSNGDSFQYTFNGTGIDYITEKSSDQGLADVYLDSVFQKTVNCYASGNRQVQQTLYSTTGLSSGPHTLKVVMKSGTVLVLDALKVYSSVSAPTSTPTLVPTSTSAAQMGMLNDTDSGITYSGGAWTYHPARGLGDYQDDVHATSSTGDAFQYTFNGTGIDYITEKSTDQGLADVYLDSVFQQTVNCYASGSRQVQQTLYSVTGLSSGPHTLKVVMKSGTVLVLDALKVYSSGSAPTSTPTLAPTSTPAAQTGTINDTNTAITYSGSAWTYHPNRGLGDYQDDVHATAVDNDYFQITFSGTGIDYITEKSTDQGLANVYLDGVYQKTVDCYTNGNRQVQQTLYSVTGLPSGSHTLKIVKQSGVVLVLDALLIHGSFSPSVINHLIVLGTPLPATITATATLAAPHLTQSSNFDG